MAEPATVFEPVDDDAAELAAMTAAVEKARANHRSVPHEEMRAWLLELAEGHFNAKPPTSAD